MALAEWTRFAEEDLDELYLYIARQDGRPNIVKENCGLRMEKPRRHK